MELLEVGVTSFNRGGSKAPSSLLMGSFCSSAESVILFQAEPSTD